MKSYTNTKQKVAPKERILKLRRAIRGLELDLSNLRHPVFSEYEINHVTVLVQSARHSLGLSLKCLGYTSPYRKFEMQRSKGEKVKVERSEDRSALGIAIRRTPMVDRLYELRDYIEKLITQIGILLEHLSLISTKHFVYLHVETTTIQLSLAKCFLGEMITKLSSTKY